MKLITDITHCPKCIGHLNFQYEEIKTQSIKRYYICSICGDWYYNVEYMRSYIDPRDKETK